MVPSDLVASQVTQRNDVAPLQFKETYGLRATHLLHLPEWRVARLDRDVQSGSVSALRPTGRGIYLLLRRDPVLNVVPRRKTSPLCSEIGSQPDLVFTAGRLWGHF